LKLRNNKQYDIIIKLNFNLNVGVPL